MARFKEELYKKDLNDPDNHDGVITDLEPDILECEVKWALESITTDKASGGDGIQVELFQILKDDAVKVLPANLENSAVATGLEKVSFHSSAKECSNYHTIALISRASNDQNSPSKALMYFQMFKLDLEKAEETEIKLPTSVGSLKKQESSRKTSISAFLTMPKPLTIWITINCGKF